VVIIVQSSHFEDIGVGFLKLLPINTLSYELSSGHDHS